MDYYLLERYCLNSDEKPPGRKPTTDEWECLNWHLLKKESPKIRSAMLCLSGFELHSRWVPVLITKEELPILKRSQNKPQTINDLQLISHLIAYNMVCF